MDCTTTLKNEVVGPPQRRYDTLGHIFCPRLESHKLQGFHFSTRNLKPSCDDLEKLPLFQASCWFQSKSIKLGLVWTGSSESLESLEEGVGTSLTSPCLPGVETPTAVSCREVPYRIECNLFDIQGIEEQLNATLVLCFQRFFLFCSWWSFCLINYYFNYY